MATAAQGESLLSKVKPPISKALSNRWIAKPLSTLYTKVSYILVKYLFLIGIHRPYF